MVKYACNSSNMGFPFEVINKGSYMQVLHVFVMRIVYGSELDIERLELLDFYTFSSELLLH